MIARANSVAPTEEYVAAILCGTPPTPDVLVASARRMPDWRCDRARFLRRQHAAQVLAETEPPKGYDGMELKHRQSIAQEILKRTSAPGLVSRLTALIHERGGLIGRSQGRQEVLNSENLILAAQERAEGLATATDANPLADAEIAKKYHASLEELDRLRELRNQYSPTAALEAREQQRILTINSDIGETVAAMMLAENMRYDAEADHGLPQL